MTKVQIDDFECPKCQEETMAELDMTFKLYHCLKCGENFYI